MRRDIDAVRPRATGKNGANLGNFRTNYLWGIFDRPIVCFSASPCHFGSCLCLSPIAVPSPPPSRERLPVELPRQDDTSPAITLRPGINEFKDRRRKRRVAVQPMYSSASIRVLSRQDGPSKATSST